MPDTWVGIGFEFTGLAIADAEFVTLLFDVVDATSSNDRRPSTGGRAADRMDARGRI